MKKKDIFREGITIFWLFIIGSVIGYVYEMILVLFQKGYFESRQGLIYGPFIPVYGIGAVVYYLVFQYMKPKSKLQVFFISMILGGLTEYICSFVQEKAFGTISWDYSYLLFHLNGRTSLLHCTYWGIAGVIYITYIAPIFVKLKQNITKNYIKIVTATLAFFMIFDIGISCFAAERQEERRKNIPANSQLDMFLDKHYSDQYMNRIFANMKNK